MRKGGLKGGKAVLRNSAKSGVLKLRGRQRIAAGEPHDSVWRRKIADNGTVFGTIDGVNMFVLDIL